jgi:signal transduction histidine kinase/ActR/RegA family two-component response regulator
LVGWLLYPHGIVLIVAVALVLLTLFSAWVIRSYDQLQRREQLLEETGRLAKVGGWEVDPDSAEGIWTPEVARIHDIDPAAVSIKGVKTQSYTPESRIRLLAALQEARERGTPYDLELELVTARGEHKWIRTICHPVVENGKVKRLRGALQDITVHKNLEARLRTKLQRLNMLEHITRATGERQDLASILQVVIRTLEEELPLDFGCICLYEPNQRALTVAAVGVKSCELAGQMSMSEQARIPIDQNGLSRCVRGQLVYEPDIAEVPFPFPRRLHKGGLRSLVAAPLQIESQVFGVLISARRQPNSFASGECEFLRQLSEHVALAAHQAQLHTALQTAYEELRNTQQSVMQQERLRVLGQMASGIAHDINNAISPIALYTDSLIESEPGLSERARSYLRTIQQATGDVAETVARMREFYRQRVGPGELVALDINAIVPEVVELTRARWEAMPQERGVVIEVRTELASPLALVMGVKSEIREALTNLVFNAVDAMPQGGTLTLRTRSDGEERVIVEVGDTGIGMNDETRRRCLEPFFTTKGERGTGLGLAMVYGVMQRHGGDLDIRSAIGNGTMVQLSFAAAPPAAPDQVEPRLVAPGRLKLLLVDDDPILLKSLRETLEQDGHNVLTASGGKEGLELFQTSLTPTGQSTISLVVTDLGMPHVDGRTVARGIKRASSSTPVILLTGWGERLLAEGEAPPNVDRVLSKPPRLRELRKAFAELTSRASNDLRETITSSRP